MLCWREIRNLVIRKWKKCLVMFQTSVSSSQKKPTVILKLHFKSCLSWFSTTVIKKNFYGSTFWPSCFDFKTGSGPNPIKIFLAQFTMRRNSSIRIESKWLDGLMQPIWKLVRKLRLKIVHSLLFWYKMFKWEFFLNLRRLFLFWAKCYFRTIS